MKQIQSKAYNVTEDIVGKITFNRHIVFHRSNYILVGEDITCAQKGFAATLTTAKNIKEVGSPICVIENVADINEGDVVVINKFGEIAFVYDLTVK